MTFFKFFLCQKLEGVGLSEIVYESFPDNDNSTILYKKNDTKRYNHTCT